MRASLKRLLRSPLVIAIVALVLRLAILYVTWHRAAPADFTERYGYETGSVARSIALGHGFSSPLLLVQTGPTAWFGPIYPYLLAAIFKVWGIYSFKSHVIAQGLNCLFSALMVFPIFGMARRSLGATTAVLASWLWVILPNAWHLPIAYVWETSLAALWFAILVWLTIALRGRDEYWRWAVYGALWAIGALISTAMISVMPFFFIWLVWQAHRQSLLWLRPAVIAALIFIIGMAPWTIRNYRVFGKFIPVRSTFGLMLWLGNNPEQTDTSVAMSVFFNEAEASVFRRMGEIDYMQSEQRKALGFIRSHPGLTLERIGERVLKHWFEVTDRPHDNPFADPPYVKTLFLFNLVFVLLGWLGTLVLWRRRSPYAAIYLTVLLIFPAVYYLTEALVRYRFPMDAILTVLAAYGVICGVERFGRYRSPLTSNRAAISSEQAAIG